MNLEVGRMYYVKACGNMIEMARCVGSCEHGGGVFEIELIPGKFEHREVIEENILSTTPEELSWRAKIKSLVNTFLP